MLLSVCETVLVSEPLRVRLQLVPAGSGRLPERRGLRDGVRGPPSPSGSCRSIVRRTSAPTKPVFPTASLRLLSRLDTATRFTAAYKRRRPQSTFAPIRLPNSIPGCPMDMNDVDPHRDEDGDMSVPLLVDGIDGVAETVLANHEDTLEAASLEDVNTKKRRRTLDSADFDSLEDMARTPKCLDLDRSGSGILAPDLSGDDGQQVLATFEQIQRRFRERFIWLALTRHRSTQIAEANR